VPARTRCGRPTARDCLERPHLARLISLGLVHDTGGQLQLSTELMANLGLTTTDKQMTTTTDISMTKPLPSR
jgi:hypothetical protein